MEAKPSPPEAREPKALPTQVLKWEERTLSSTHHPAASSSQAGPSTQGQKPFLRCLLSWRQKHC